MISQLTSPLVIYDLLMLSGILEEEDDERDLKSWALAIIESGAAESSVNWIDFLISMTTLLEHSQQEVDICLNFSSKQILFCFCSLLVAYELINRIKFWKIYLVFQNEKKNFDKEKCYTNSVF